MTDKIMVFVEHQDGKLTRGAWEAIAAVQHLSKDLSLQVVGVLLGLQGSALASEVATTVQSVVVGESPLLANYTADGFALALRCIISTHSPQFVIFPHTYQVRDFAPKLASSLHRALVSDCLGYRKEQEKVVFTRQVFQGKYCADVELTGEGPHFISFQASAFREDSVERGATLAKVETVAIELSPDGIRAKHEPKFREAKQAVDLTQASAIVAIGRGIKAPENVELAQKLADALGAEIGASRPICDNGWLTMDRQIGSSGQTVSPKLYVALGISGAIQHMVGMKGAKTIVAINKDKEAPIFEVATYGIVGDLFEVVPPLVEEIRKIRGT